MCQRDSHVGKMPFLIHRKKLQIFTFFYEHFSYSPYLISRIALALSRMCSLKLYSKQFRKTHKKTPAMEYFSK